MCMAECIADNQIGISSNDFNETKLPWNSRKNKCRVLCHWKFSCWKYVNKRDWDLQFRIIIVTYDYECNTSGLPVWYNLIRFLRFFFFFSPFRCISFEFNFFCFYFCNECNIWQEFNDVNYGRSRRKSFFSLHFLALAWTKIIII